MQGTPNAEFHPGLAWTKAQLVIRKSFRRHIDSYSAFFENDHRTPTGLEGYLRERGLTAVALAVLPPISASTSRPSTRQLGFEVEVIERACRAIDLDGSLEAARRQWAEAGVQVD